jgi:IMP cyclohydrolase
MEKWLAQLKYEAAVNFSRLAANSYVGRGAVVGLDESGKLIQLFWLAGRSPNSRNRLFETDGSRLFTVAADPSKVTDASLVFYNAMREVRSSGVSYAVVGNGKQTDKVAHGFANDESFHSIVEQCRYDPDAPHFTPGITACCHFSPETGRAKAAMSILRKARWSSACDRFLFEYDELWPELGYCLTTYVGDGEPLPSFRGEPYLVPLFGEGPVIARTYWDAFDPENRVALAVKSIPRDGRSELVIINQYQKVAEPA